MYYLFMFCAITLYYDYYEMAYYKFSFSFEPYGEFVLMVRHLNRSLACEPDVVL